MTRLGGINRIIESSNTSKLCILEIAIYPPSRIEEGLGDIGGFNEAVNQVLSLNVPYNNRMNIASEASLSHLEELFGMYIKYYAVAINII